MSKPRGLRIAGNWKMNQGVAETRAFFESLSKIQLPSGKSFAPGVTSSLYVPALSLSAAKDACAKAPAPWNGIAIGVQNAHWEKSGAYTGEISGPMLLEAGVKTVLIGHSERRQFFGETSETAFKRTVSLLQQGFEVMLCVGETRAQREAGQTESCLREQLAPVTFGGSTGPLMGFWNGRLLIAYEPVWAIGTGLTATPSQANDAHAFIRKLLKDQVGPDAAAKTPILYGGSVTPKNVAELMAQPEIDGALVGGASLKPDSFSQLF
ncbi:MAG: triose-phosphate isomerase [Bdellovibrionales bacterium]|nr:triose-phosphate isomerase [Bdellovibrionales bacterium]